MSHSFSTSRGTVDIREAGPTDAIDFRELRLDALRDSPLAFSADYRKNLHHPSKYWEDILTMQPDESTIFLAGHQKHLIGMTGIARGGSPKTRHSAVVWGVYVKPEWRGLHIAEELIHTCLAWATARDIVIAKLGVAADNVSAIRCYERCGFKIYGTEPRSTFYEGQYFDGLLMFRSLDNS